MKWLGTPVAAITIVVLGLVGTASAQSLRDAPAGGNDVCDGAEGFEGQAGPFEPVRSGFVENGCGGSDGGEDPGDDGGEDGGEESNPFCDGLAQAPEEMAPLTGPIGEGAGCAAPGGDEGGEEEVATPPQDPDDSSGGNTVQVLGETEAAPDTGGSGALPATGAELLAGASLGLASLGTALTRRFLR